MCPPAHWVDAMLVIPPLSLITMLIMMSVWFRLCLQFLMARTFHPSDRPTGYLYAVRWQYCNKIVNKFFPPSQEKINLNSTWMVTGREGCITNVFVFLLSRCRIVVSLMAKSVRPAVPQLPKIEIGETAAGQTSRSEVRIENRQNWLKLIIMGWNKSMGDASRFTSLKTQRAGQRTFWHAATRTRDEALGLEAISKTTSIVYCSCLVRVKNACPKKSIVFA